MQNETCYNQSIITLQGTLLREGDSWRYDSTMQVSRGDVLNFISIANGNKNVKLYFTSAAIDILGSSYVAMNDEVARVLCNKLEAKCLTNSRYVKNKLKEAEEEVLCDTFISDTFPKLEIVSHITKDKGIEITATHCGAIKCERCLENTCLALKQY